MCGGPNEGRKARKLEGGKGDPPWSVAFPSSNPPAVRPRRPRCPSLSPPRGAVWGLSGGYLGGSRGEVGVGPADGLTGALRYEVPFGAVGASLGLAYARTSRFVEA